MNPGAITAALRLGALVIPPVGLKFRWIYTPEDSRALYSIVYCEELRLRYSYGWNSEVTSLVSLAMWWECAGVVELPPDCPPFEQWQRLW